MTNRLLAFVLFVEFLVAVASWLFSALGHPVNNLLSDEGLRWMLRYGIGPVLSGYFCTLVLACVAVGALPKLADRAAWGRLAVYMLVLWMVALVFVLWSESPLRGVGGGVFPSPFAGALPELLCLSVIVASVAVDIRSAGDLLVRGIRRYAILIVFYLLLSFLVSEFVFLWQ